MTQSEVTLCEQWLRDSFDSFLRQRLSDDIVVGDPHKDDRTVKLRMTKDQDDLIQGNVSMNELVTELDIYSLRHKKKIILSSFTLTPTIYDPNDPMFVPKRGILATFRLVDKDEDKPKNKDRFKLDIYG